jgi:hypothetical protein
MEVPRAVPVGLHIVPLDFALKGGVKGDLPASYSTMWVLLSGLVM